MAALGSRGRSGVETCQNNARAGVEAVWDEGRRRGRVVTVGTVFILGGKQAAGESSLVEALVTTRFALWHVKVLEDYGMHAARRNSGRGQGLRQTVRPSRTSWSEVEGAAEAPALGWGRGGAALKTRTAD